MQQVGDNLYLEKVVCSVSGRSFPATTLKTSATNICSSGFYMVHYNVDERMVEAIYKTDAHVNIFYHFYVAMVLHGN